MKHIYELLEAGTYPNTLTISVDLEISQSTAKRDIEFMRDRLSLPIAYDSVRHGYHFTRRPDPFPGRTITETELFALKVACKSIDQYHGAPLQNSFRSAIERFSARLNWDDRARIEKMENAIGFRARALEEADVRSFHLIMRAITRCCAVVFEYRKPGCKAAGVRRVHPYHLMAFENRWYLLGNDPARGEMRKFVLKRMQKLRLIAADRFERPHDFNPETYLRTSFGIMTGRKDYEIAIEMDAWLTDILRGRRWHPAQVWTELPDGSSYLRLRLSCLEEIEQWVLSWGSHATVIRPTALAARVAASAREMVAKYFWVNQE
jgi:proteasome accessory factor B